MSEDVVIQECTVDAREDDRCIVTFESGLRLTTTVLLGAGGFGKVYAHD